MLSPFKFTALMIALSAFAIVWLTITSLILIRNALTFLPAGRKSRDRGKGSEDSAIQRFRSEDPSELLRVSVCIPARNEEAVIARCVKSVMKQDYPLTDIWVLNDRSEDRTGDILMSLQRESGPVKLHVLEGDERPDGWLGKPWACEQIGRKADGDILVFLDADTWLHPQAISEIVMAFETDGADAITIWPEQVFGSAVERTVIPLVYFALFTMLPADYVRRFPVWMPKIVRPFFKTAFAAACGQCIAFRRQAYETIGRHQRVKDQIVEDVELAKALKKDDLKLIMYHGIQQVYCRMYTRGEDIWSGFRKNFMAGFGYNIPFFLLAKMLHIAVYLGPYASAGTGIATGNHMLTKLSLSAIILIHLQRYILDRMNNWSVWHGLSHPLGVLWFQRLGITVLLDHLFNREVHWKGRSVTSK